MLKRIVSVILLLIWTLSLASCYSAYFDEEYQVGFTLRSKEDVSHTDGSIVIQLDDKLTAAVFVRDALEAADEQYFTLYEPSQLDLHSGAYEANYNNPAYISKLFEYLFAGGEREYSVYGIREDVFGAEAYPAGRAGFTSKEDTVNGYVYLTVAHARCVIVCIYVYDTMLNIHKYDKKIERFTENFTIAEVKESE